MCVVKHAHFDYLLATLKEYEIGAYLVSAEVTKDSHKETEGEHFHFVVQMSVKDYAKFSKRVFIDKFKLRGKALPDKPRQYGRCKKIEDFNRMCAYTIKDGNFKTNMSESQLQTFKDITFKGKETKLFRDNLMDYLKDKLKPQTHGQYGLVYNTNFEIMVEILNYYRQLKDPITLSKSQIESHLRYYQMYVNKEMFSSEDIIKQMFPFN